MKNQRRRFRWKKNEGSLIDNLNDDSSRVSDFRKRNYSDLEEESTVILEEETTVILEDETKNIRRKQIRRSHNKVKR